MSLRLWGNEKIVNTTTVGNQYAPAVAGLVGGGYVIAWTDSSGPISRLLFQRYDALGAKVGVETLVPFDGDGNQSNPQILAMADGGFVIGYIDQDLGVGDGDDVRTALYSATGTLVNQSEVGVLSVDFVSNSLTARDVGFMQGRSSFLVSSGIETLTFSSTGVADNNSVVEDKNNFSELQVDLATNATTGKIVAVYADVDTANVTESIKLEFADVFNQDFIATPIDVSGTLSGSNFTLRAPQVTWVGADRIAVVWEDELHNDLFYRLFDAAGVATTPVIEIASVSALDQSKIVDLKNGTFAIVYHKSAGLIQNTCIRVFDAYGTQMGVELVVNTNGQTNSEPDVTALTDGRLVVTWTQQGAPGDGSDAAVMQQILDPRDGIVNGTDNAALAETLTGNDTLGDQMRGYAGNDTMHGLAGADVMYGGDGIDTLFGGRGDDTLYGDAGTDVLNGGLGADDIYGGTGTDTLVLSGTRGVGVVANLLLGFGLGGEAEGDSYFEIENIVGSHQNDVLTLGIAAGRLDGLNGDDNLTGGNSLDSFFGGNGADQLNGGGGVDRAFYSSSTAVNINLLTNVSTGGEAQGDTFFSIEEISGSAQGDTIIGNALNNRFFGQSGNDRLGGGTGVDTLVGGAGSDTFVFGLGDTGQTATTVDLIQDYTKGAVGTGDTIDFTSTLSIGGVSAAATATQASIDQATGLATFAAGSGTTMADALADIVTSFTTGGNAAGEFALFRVNNAGDHYMLISDGVAGLGVNDVLVQLGTVTSIGSITLSSGDLTILA